MFFLTRFLLTLSCNNFIKFLKGENVSWQYNVEKDKCEKTYSKYCGKTTLTNYESEEVCISKNKANPEIFGCFNLLKIFN